jgi:RND family efflux transporter MFP subunit
MTSRPFDGPYCWHRAHARGRLLLLALLAGACQQETASGKAPSSQTGAQTKAPRKVQLAVVEKREMARSLVVTGTLAADDMVVVSTKVPGTLASIAIDLGTQVTRGQVIAQLQTTDYQLRVDQAASSLAQARALLGLAAQGEDEQVDVEQTSTVRQAQASLEEAKANLERARQLVEQRLIARAEFDTANTALVRAQSALDNAREDVSSRLAVLRQRRSELQLARQQLADTSLRAPLDGIVQAKQASPGEYLGVGSPIATIVRVNPLRLRAEIPERDAASVQVGQGVQVTVDGQTGTYNGKVARLAPTLSEQNRTLMIEAEIENPGNLRPGNFARAQIRLEGAAAVLTVPTSALVTFAGIEKVITVVAGKAVEKQVVTGRRTEDLTEIVSGLEANEHVVTKPGNLQQGQPVVVAGS